MLCTPENVLECVALVVPVRRLLFVHVCGVPEQATYSTEELLHACRAERLPPGEEASTSRPSSTICPPDIPIAPDVPTTAKMAADGPEAAALLTR